MEQSFRKHRDNFKDFFEGYLKSSALISGLRRLTAVCPRLICTVVFHAGGRPQGFL